MARIMIEAIILGTLVVDLFCEGGTLTLILFAFYLLIHRPGSKAGMGLGLLFWARMVM